MKAQSPPGFWSSIPIFSLGCVVGLIALVSMRVVYYRLMGYEPNMHPGIAFLFLPLLLPLVLVVALPIEALLRLMSKPSTRLQVAVIGCASASLLSWWAFPSHWQIIVFVNPVVLRWIVIRVGGHWSNKQMLQMSE